MPMIKYIYDRTGIRLIRTEGAIPVHNKDFCDVCGDCLACYGEDDCLHRPSPNGFQPHFWVEYEEEK